MYFLQMSGFPGSGKSTLARRIGKITGAIVIDHDIVKSSLLESLGADHIDTKAAGKISYNIEWSLIDFHLSQGHSVILDSPCFYTEMVEKGLTLCQKHHATYKYVECYVNDFEVINHRLKTRERKISQIPYVESEEMFKHSLDNSKRQANDAYIMIDTSRHLDSYIDEVIQYIQELEY